MGKISRRAQANAIKQQVGKDADTLVKHLRLSVRGLCEVMAEIHGGTWSVHIDHEAQFVSVSRDFPPNDCIQPSQLREAV